MISHRDASILLLAVCSVLVDGRCAWGTTLHVPADYATIQLAIDAAAAGDTVEVACGTYYEHHIAIPQSLVLTSETGLPACVTVDAEQAGPVFSTPQAPTTIRGLTIRGGAGGGGAGISCVFFRLTLEQCLFQSNHATQRGGALYCNQAAVSANDCRFEGNTAAEGGAVFIAEGRGAFVGCAFTGNSASGVSDPHDGGGAVAITLGMGSTSEFDNCMFTENSAPLGGAIHSDSQTGTILRHCVVSGNTALYGAGLYGRPYYGGRFTIESTVIAGNVATVRAGGASLSSATLRGCTIAGNSAATGGGLGVSGGCTIENSILWGNCATDGHQLYVNAQFPHGSAGFSCSVVDTSGDWFATGSGPGEGTVEWIGDNQFEDPLFCDPLVCDETPATGGDYSVGAGSPCLPKNSGGCDLIGCCGLGGCTTAVDDRTWGRVKALFR